MFSVTPKISIFMKENQSRRPIDFELMFRSKVANHESKVNLSWSSCMDALVLNCNRLTGFSTLNLEIVLMVIRSILKVLDLS